MGINRTEFLKSLRAEGTPRPVPAPPIHRLLRDDVSMMDIMDAARAIHRTSADLAEDARAIGTRVVAAILGDGKPSSRIIGKVERWYRDALGVKAWGDVAPALRDGATLAMRRAGITQRKRKASPKVAVARLEAAIAYAADVAGAVPTCDAMRAALRLLAATEDTVGLKVTKAASA